jgi:hypothetical protein
VIDVTPTRQRSGVIPEHSGRPRARDLEACVLIIAEPLLRDFATRRRLGRKLALRSLLEDARAVERLRGCGWP